MRTTLNVARWLALSAAVVGGVVALWNKHDTHGDLAYLKRSRTNGRKLLIAKANYRREWARVIKAMIYLVISLGSFRLHRATLAAGKVAVGLHVLFAALSVLTAALSFQDRRVRHKLQNWRIYNERNDDPR